MTVSHPPAGRPAGRAPEVWGKVPPQNKNFTGRGELLAALREGIVNQVTAVVPHALHGMGGVGKTQMAVEYAYRYRDDYDLVWWIPADQPVLVRSTLAALAPHLNLPPATTSGIEDAAYAVLNALRRGEPYSKWLLIFDNADQPEELTEIIPHGPGHVLITSRNQRWEGVVDTVAVDVFSREESVEFLGRRVPGKAMSEAEAKRLAGALGDLPLALEQAGALQAETGMAVSEYLRLLQERTSQLLAEGKPTEYPHSMTAAWGLSVAGLGERLPEAVALLRCCAFFGPEPIPRDVFSRPQSGLGKELRDLLGDPIRLTRAIGELGRYALARIDSGARTIQVHRLIQALLRDELPQDEQQRIRTEVHLLLAGYAPAEPDAPGNWRRYDALLGHIGPSEVAASHDAKVRVLAHNVVRYLSASGAFQAARSLMEGFVKQWSADSGDHVPEVLEGRRLLADILRELGRYRDAGEIDQDILERLEMHYGAALNAGETAEAGGVPADDRVVNTWLRTLNSIGADLRAQGEFPAALTRDEDALKRHRTILGEDHRRTLRAVNNLALDHALASRYLAAKELHTEAYLGFCMLDDDKIGVLVSWGGLARAVRLCGDYSEARDLGEAAYAYGVDEFGPDYPWTLRAAKDLSIAWRRTGDYEQAHSVALDMHGRYVRLYGLDHPDTLSAAMCLANVQRAMGEIEEAFALAADTVRRYPQIYGPEHPYHHGCAGNLAVLHRVLGDPGAARTLNEAAYAGLKAALGDKHHYTLTVAANLASDLMMLGEAEAACRLGEDTLQQIRTTLGEEHPMTLSCAANLAADKERIGEHEESAKLFDETMDGYARTLGLEHPDAKVAAARRHLDADFDPPPI